MTKIWREFSTILQFFWVISSETILYFIYKNWSNYIKRVANKLAHINILYVKLFQAIASNQQLIDEQTNNELLRFTDNAPWTYDDIRLQDLIEIESQYGLYLCDSYDKPINSGMISLVFKGYKLKSGTPVIIKMKRNDIELKLNNAIQNLKVLLYFLSFIPIINKYQISEVINRNIEIIRHQTNFQKEVENILIMKNNCANLKYVKIPNVYSDVTRKHPSFIMMEYIEGLKINDLNEEDYLGFSKQVLKFGLVTTIIHGVTHGDLHSGNILFIKDKNDEKYPYKIGVIDFGIIFEIEQKYKETLFDLLTQIFDRPPRESVIQVLNSVIIAEPEKLNKIPKEDYDSIVNIGTELFTLAINDAKHANQIQLYKFLATIKDYLNKKEIIDLGIKPSDNFVKTQLVLAMAHGVTLTLCKNNFMPLIDDVLNELFHTKILLEDDI